MDRNTALWAGVLTGPIAWMISFGANWVLVPWACTLGWMPALYIVTVIALVIVAASGLLAWREWRQTGEEPPGEGGNPIARARAMAIGGVALSAMFFLTILVQAIPNVVLAGCQ